MKRTSLIASLLLVSASLTCLAQTNDSSPRGLYTNGSTPGTCRDGAIMYKTGASAGVYLCASNTWTIQGAGGGGSGASSIAQLTDFSMARTSSTRLTITMGGSAPSSVGFGTTIYAFSSNATVDISSGSGTAYFYVTTAGAVSAGATSTLTCNGQCSFVNGISAFPINVWPIATWTYTSGAWNVGGYTDLRTIGGGKPVTCGSGLTCTDSGSSLSIALDTAAIPPAYRTCSLAVGTDNGAALANADLGPQGRQCFIAYAATIIEVIVAADAGTPNVIVRRNRAGTTANTTSSALATAAAGGLACSNTGGTTGLDGTTLCSSTLQNTGLNAGDWLELGSGTAGGTAKRMSVAITYTAN